MPEYRRHVAGFYAPATMTRIVSLGDEGRFISSAMRRDCSSAGEATFLRAYFAYYRASAGFVKFCTLPPVLHAPF